MAIDKSLPNEVEKTIELESPEDSIEEILKAT